MTVESDKPGLGLALSEGRRYRADTSSGLDADEAPIVGVRLQRSRYNRLPRFAEPTNTN